MYIECVASWNSFTPPQLLAFTRTMNRDDAPLLALGISGDRLSHWEFVHSEIESHDGQENLLWCRTILRHTGDDNERSTLWAYLWARPAGDRWLVTPGIMPVQVCMRSTTVLVFAACGKLDDVVTILGVSMDSRIALASPCG